MPEMLDAWIAGRPHGGAIWSLVALVAVIVEVAWIVVRRRRRRR